MKNLILLVIAFAAGLGLSQVVFPSATAAPAPVVAFDGCADAWEQAFAPPSFSCPFGTPNPTCMAIRAEQYQTAMQAATYAHCQAVKAAQDQKDNDLRNCLLQLLGCTDVPPGFCSNQYSACCNSANSTYNASVAAADAALAQAEADAQDEYLESALDCCPP